MTYSLTWDLDSLFAGGATSPALKKRLELLGDQIQAFAAAVDRFDPEAATPNIKAVLGQQEIVGHGLNQCASFVNNLIAANVKDDDAKAVYGKIMALIPLVQQPDTLFTQKLAAMADDTFAKLMATPTYADVAFRLTETRRDGKKLLSAAEENIISQLRLDGINAWSENYDLLVNTIEIDFNGQKLSAGQAFNRMMGDPDAAVRAELFAKWEDAWAENTDLFAATLNHLAGFRLTEQKLHHEDDFMTEPLQFNRLQKATVDMMWATIEKNLAPFAAYLTRKAQLFGKEKIAWQDQDAPIILGSLSEKRYTFDEGAAFILKNFRQFSPKMADFAQMAFEKSWIEAEDRPGKRPGGYCTSLPESQESRIFMTYGGSINEVATLAHELGHAFHSSVMWDLPDLNQDYASNVAETASTFAELIVADAALKQASTPEEKINLIDTKMQNAIAMFMNIHARYIFEQEFYTARKEGIVSAAELTAMMTRAQEKAYAGALATAHPHFWSSKLHFYIDSEAFYNFPYTFGYLFSTGIYALANKKGTSFEDDYIALLRDTASMTTEDLAKKHLGVDLSTPDFWQAGIDQIKGDIDEFLALTEEFI